MMYWPHCSRSQLVALCVLTYCGLVSTRDTQQVAVYLSVEIPSSACCWVTNKYQVTSSSVCGHRCLQLSQCHGFGIVDGEMIDAGSQCLTYKCDGNEREFRKNKTSTFGIHLRLVQATAIEPSIARNKCKVPTPRQVVFHHDSENRTHVNDYENRGSYVRTVIYEASHEDMRAVIEHSITCRQFVRFEAHKARMKEYAYWTSITGTQHSYFPSGTSSNPCLCSGIEECCCIAMGQDCNADIANEFSEWVTDEGYLTDAAELPVLEVSFGDTGGVTEQGYHTLGPLECQMEVEMTGDCQCFYT